MTDKLSIAVYERDSYACLVCGSLQLDAPHHLIARSQDPTRIEELENLATVCRKCHDSIEKREKGFDQWKIAGWEDLGKFWLKYHAGKVYTVKKPQIPTESDLQVRRAQVLTKEQIADPEASLAIQRRFLDAVHNLRTGFVTAATVAAEIMSTGAWRVNHETIEDFLKDPEIGMERSKFYRLAKLGEFLGSNFKPGDVPTLTERAWTRDLLPLTDTLPADDVKKLAFRAMEIPYHDWEAEVQALKTKKAHPEVEVLLNSDMEVWTFPPNEQRIGFVRRAWANPEYQFVVLKLEATELAKAIRTGGLSIRIQ